MKIGKNSLLLLIFLLFMAFNLSATEQEPDEIIINGKKAFIQTSWQYPSIIEEYFISKKIPYPFEMLHTANYRGHVAVFEIKDNTLYLKSFNGGQIEEFDKKENRIKLEFKSKIENVKRYFFKKENKPIPVSWFSGFILILVDFKKTPINCDKYDNDKKCHYYSYEKYIITKVNNGKIVKKTEIKEKDFANCYKELHDKPKIKECNGEFFKYINHNRSKKGFQHNMKGM